MRVAILFMVLLLGGCLSTQPAKNPLKAKKPKKAEVADKVELMEQMFLVQKNLNARILQLAVHLTPDELQEFNEFLAPYGTRLRAKICSNLRHDHSKPGHKSWPKPRGEAF